MTTTTHNFTELLTAQQAKGNFVCVGLDSDVKKLPKHLVDELGAYGAQLEFNKRIIDATKDFAGAYKPNLAFYHGTEGKAVLRQTIEYINEQAPNVPVILDAKYGDIGNTNDGYVAEVEYYGADAVTVHNYMGMEAMKPFLECANKGVIVLCRTSNPGAGEIQDVMCEPVRQRSTGKLYSTTAELRREQGLAEETVIVDLEAVRMPLYLFVAHRVVQSWNYNVNCLMVVGATTPNELAEVRKVAGLMALLLPGIGAQGGKMEPTLDAGKNADDQGMSINNSRSVLFAYKDDDEHSDEEFDLSARIVGLEMHYAIRSHLGLSV
jgi:orotidine-5'-phosphate decarboxylase